MVTIISSLITAAVALIVCIINNWVQRVAHKEQQDKMLTLIEYRIMELEKKVEKHNNLVERMAINERDMKTAYKKIDELQIELRRR